VESESLSPSQAENSSRWAPIIGTESPPAHRFVGQLDAPTWRDASFALILLSGLYQVLAAVASYGLGGYLAGLMHMRPFSSEDAELNDGLHGLLCGGSLLPDIDAERGCVARGLDVLQIEEHAIRLPRRGRLETLKRSRKCLRQSFSHRADPHRRSYDGRELQWRGCYIRPFALDDPSCTEPIRTREDICKCRASTSRSSPHPTAADCRQHPDNLLTCRLSPAPL